MRCQRQPARARLLAYLLCSGLLACAAPEGTSDLAATYTVDPATGLRVPSLGPVPDLPEWPDNAPSESKRRLGRALFFDARLSGTGRVACVTCHVSTSSFQAGLPLDSPDRSYPHGIPRLPRNTPSLLNLIYAPVFRYDGSHGTDLYEQLALPFAEANMNLTPGVPSDDVHTVDVPLAQRELKRRLTEEVPGYVDFFRDAFDADIRELPPEETWTLAGKAMAVFLRGAVSRDAPFDRWNAGDDDAMSAAAVRGLRLFQGKGACQACHSGPFFSDFRFHNLSLELPDEHGKRHDEGRALVTGLEGDRGAFLTPTLRSVTKSPPFFHDGSVVSLRRVIMHKTHGAALRDPLHSPALELAQPLDEDEIDDLIAFLQALAGEPLPSEVTAPPPLSELP